MNLISSLERYYIIPPPEMSSHTKGNYSIATLKLQEITIIKKSLIEYLTYYFAWMNKVIINKLGQFPFENSA